eukprot:5385267-Amphidinium_carterae.1
MAGPQRIKRWHAPQPGGVRMLKNPAHIRRQRIDKLPKLINQEVRIVHLRPALLVHIRDAQGEV